MNITERKIGEIQPYGRNAKKHPDSQIKQIADSIREFGFNQPIVVDKDGVIIVGHGRYAAATLLGLETVPVLEIRIPIDKANAYRLADNKLNESDWDMQQPVGRPDLLNDEMRRKIEEVAALDGTVEEMAYYCGVHRSTLYNWFKEDPALFDRVEALRNRPVLAARQEVVKGIKDDKNFAMRYLERKRAKEFMPSAKIEHAGQISVVPGEIDPVTEQIKNEFEDRLRIALSDGDEAEDNKQESNEPISAPVQETAPEAKP